MIRIGEPASAVEDMRALVAIARRSVRTEPVAD